MAGLVPGLSKRLSATFPFTKRTVISASLPTQREEVPETAYSSDPMTTDLVRALQQLSPRERECVVLRHYLDLSEKDTAATLRISVGAVKSYTAKGLARLRPLLSATIEEERHV